MFTGMTKDGTFLIENGVVTKPLRNLRFTDSILDGVFRSIELISSKRKLYGGNSNIPSGYMVPAIKVGKFNFTGATDH
jgi:predicted Zn-dependent protease